MDYKQFEENITNKFEDYTPLPDNEKIWEQVEPHLPKKKNRLWLFLLFGVMSLSVLGTSMVFYIDSEISELHEAEVSELLEAEQTTLEKLNNLDQKVEKLLKEKAEAQEEVILTKEEKLNSQKQSANSISNEKNTNNTRQVNDKAYTNQKPYTRENIKNNIQSNQMGFSTTRNNVIPQNGSASNTELNLPNEINNVSQEHNSRFTVDNINAFSVVEQISSTIQYDVSAIIPMRISLNGPTIAKQEEVVPENGGRIAIGLFAGPMLSRSSYSASTAMGDELSQLRKNVEQQLETIQAGLELEYKLSNHWLLQSGLNFTRINERSTHTISDSETIIIQDTIIGILHEQDAESFVIGTAEGERTTIKTIERINNRNLIGIPISIFYSFSSESKLSFDIGVGYEYNFSVDHKVNEILLNQIEYDGVDQSIFNKNLHFGLAELRMRYALNEQFDLSFSANTKLGLNGVYTSENQIQKKYSLFGVKAGLNYKF